VVDRFLQQAVMQVLQQRFDPTFSAHSYGFRPARSAHQAVEKAQEYILAGHTTVVDIDLEKFFDRVNHDILMGLLAKRISDKRVLKLIRAFLNAGVMENGLVSPTEEGTPQGGPLSPLLSNVMLDVLDRELEARNLRFVRYADDCNIYVSSERAGHRVMASVTQFLSRRLKLKVNESKSAVAPPWERKFLGFTFLNTDKVHRSIAPQAVKRFQAKVRDITRRHGGRSVDQMMGRLQPYMNGWRGYFGFCQTPNMLRTLESWIRRRLRAVIWEQWKTAPNRYAHLRKMGLGAIEASRAVGSARNHGAWRVSHTPPLDRALPVAYFTKLGLPNLAPPRPR
jgi:RNA-directed DNA polymerase